MFTKSQISNMNNDRKYASSPWIKSTENNSDDKELFKLYATNNASISTCREYISLPANKILTPKDYIKYNIMK
jgi:hypothetical protein